MGSYTTSSARGRKQLLTAPILLVSDAGDVHDGLVRTLQGDLQFNVHAETDSQAQNIATR